jgi:uncharacterized phage protein (predicted DNA packaging)
MEDLLPKVKANLILTHDVDDKLLRGIIRAALDYAKLYQKRKRIWTKLPPSTEQATIMLASHWYESRTGGTGGFFADTATAANTTIEAVHRLLGGNKEWWHI